MTDTQGVQPCTLGAKQMDWAIRRVELLALVWDDLGPFIAQSRAVMNAPRCSVAAWAITKFELDLLLAHQTAKIEATLICNKEVRT